ncbi:MAG TPA: glycosyltransferase family 4 protein [Geminicoccus sp.]|uniref:glycosyltransferase family 4 protein n=1 Tax=Geminicoccus sp. TaxID=2024832 RepID=UPI002B81DD4D|nr:glycosyltransferase family 4 protein [Geminicoccus sp.]HWL67287.1 glycosyltransferase family 4 protein [Geminicoccus sp.]
MTLRVAFVSQPRDSLKGAGPQSGSVAIVLDRLVEALGTAVEPLAIAPRLPGQAGSETSSGGLAIHRVATDHRQVEKALELLDPRVLPRLMRPAYYRTYFRGAAARLATLNPAIVHVMTSTQAGPLLRQALPGVPLVLHLHDDMLTRLPPADSAARLAPFAAIVTCSDWLAQALRAHVPEAAGRIWPIGNGIDPPALASAERGPRPIRRLLMVGRISPEKGPHVLLESFAQLAPAYPELTLDLVGPVGLLPLCHARLMAKGEPAMAEAVRRFYGTGLQALAAQFISPGKTLQARLLALVPPELQPRIRFVGPLPHDRLAAAYEAADLLVQPSVCREGFGLPVAEAMGQGLPVVAAGHGGLLDLVQPGRTGRLVAPGDAQALAGAIRDLIDDPAGARAFGLAGRELALQHFTWRHAARRLLDVYRRITTP